MEKIHSRCYRDIITGLAPRKLKQQLVTGLAAVEIWFCWEIFTSTPFGLLLKGSGIVLVILTTYRSILTWVLTCEVVQFLPQGELVCTSPRYKTDTAGETERIKWHHISNTTVAPLLLKCSRAGLSKFSTCMRCAINDKRKQGENVENSSTERVKRGIWLKWNKILPHHL